MATHYLIELLSQVLQSYIMHFSENFGQRPQF